MKVTNLTVSNYRCFESATVELDAGVTVIHGANGAGKTTLLEAILFGLYGARALDDATLEDVITSGTDEAVIELDFSHDTGQYHIDRELAFTGDRPSTRQCVLTTPAGGSVEGARPVREYVTELLRMDADAFVNSAYVKQGEINKLLHATPAERQSMIDELLQLGKLEDYRDRADSARLAVRSLQSEQQELIDEVTTQIEPLQSPDPYAQQNELETERDRVEARLEEYSKQRDDLISKQREIDEAIDRIDETRERISTLDSRRAELQETIKSTEDTRSSIGDELATLREQRSEARSARDELIQSLELESADELDKALDIVQQRQAEVEEEIEALRDQIQSTQAKKAEATERLESVGEQLESIADERQTVTEAIGEDQQVIEERSAELSTIEDAIDDLGATLPEWPIEPARREEQLKDAKTQLEERTQLLREARERVAALSEHIEQAESLLAEEKCPTCGQPVDDAPHVERLDRDREELESASDDVDRLETAIDELQQRIDTHERIDERTKQADTIETLIDERRSTLSEREERLARLDERVEKFEATRSSTTAKVETIEAAIDELRSSVGECSERMQRLREREGELRELRDIVSRITSIDEKIDGLRERRADLKQVQHERMDQLDEITAKLHELEAALDEDRLSQLEAARTNLQAELDETESQLDELGSTRDQLNERLGSVQTDIEQLERLKERRDELSTRHTKLDTLGVETETIGELYESVRANLRERNVSTLERLLNETFDMLYRNDAYDRLHLDADYTLAISQKDGTKLDPSQLSGGERAIFNLSLRCAIYRLLAEGVEGSAPMPPLMLDEPTVFLDEGHVSRLLRLLEAMREMGVEQTLVVSHHEALLDAAEQLIAVEKDPTTNRSSVRQLAPGPHLT